MNFSRRPPSCVVVQARCHWVMSGTILVSVALLHLVTRNNAVIGISGKGYAITLGLGLIYGLTGVLIWFGTPVGRYLNYVCSLIYLTRPRLGLRLWADMRSPEFKAHFSAATTGARKKEEI